MNLLVFTVISDIWWYLFWSFKYRTCNTENSVQFIIKKQNGFLGEKTIVKSVAVNIFPKY